MAGPVSSIGTSLRQAVAGFWSRFNGWGLSRIRLLLPGARFDYEREAGDLWSNSVVACAIKWIGDRCARPLVHVCRIASNGDYEPIGRHPVTDLWNKPNPYYGRRTLEKAVGLSLVCDGNAYVYKRRARSGKPVELWWIPHDRCLPMWPADGSEYITSYRIRVDGYYYEVPKEDIVHIRDGIDPRNERLGLSALKAQVREICTINNEGTFTASLLRNSAVPGLMIVPDDDKLRPTRDHAEEIKERIRDTFTGEGSGDAVVMAGKYKIQPIGFSPEQLRLDKLPQTAMAKLASACGVPLMAMGLPDPGKTYSNLAEASKIGWGTIQGMQEIVADALRWGLVSEFDDPHSYIVEYVYEHISELQEDMKSRSDRVRGEWKDGIRRRDEAREELGLEPIGGEDGEAFFPGTTAQAGPDLTAAVPGDPLDPLADETIKAALDLLANIKATLPNDRDPQAGDRPDAGGRRRLAAGHQGTAAA